MNTIYKWMPALALMLLWTLSTAAQKVYSLEECRALAIQNNVKVQNAIRDVDAALQEQKVAYTNYFPSVSASLSGFGANKGLMQMDMGPDMNLSLMKNGIMGGVTLTQPVYAGGQIRNANRLAALGVEASVIKREQSEDEVRLTVEQYFWQVVMLQEKLRTLHAVDQQLESIQKDVEMAVNAGITTRNDLLQVRLRRNENLSTGINLENNLSVCQMLLAQYMGLNTDTIAVGSSIPIDTIPPFPQDLYCDHAGALAQTTGYRLLDTNVRANRLQQKITEGKNLPSVAVGGGYMYDNLMDKSHAFAIGFITVSVPISGWWGGSHAVKKQKLMVANAESQLVDNSQLLLIAMQKAWADVQNAYKQIIIAQNSIEQSKENLRLNQDYYRAGTSTMSDLLDAQTLYQQSRDKYVETYAQFQIKTLQYLQSTGR
ncbi:MAG: TolC family protein [Sodaliphilus sp.]